MGKGNVSASTYFTGIYASKAMKNDSDYINFYRKVERLATKPNKHGISLVDYLE